MSDTRNINPEFNRRLDLNFRYHNVKFGRKSSETDSRIGEKPGATTSSGVATNKGAPGSWSASASGNAPCWNASVGYTVPIRTPIEITITTAITITGMVTTATAARNREAIVMG